MTIPEESNVAQVQVYGSSTIIATPTVLSVLSFSYYLHLLTSYLFLQSEAYDSL